MSCKHERSKLIDAFDWCVTCGAVRVGDAPWLLPESEQREVYLDSRCPICEFGDPLPVELDADGKKIWRWTCRHWIKERPKDVGSSSKEDSHGVT